MSDAVATQPPEHVHVFPEDAFGNWLEIGKCECGALPDLEYVLARKGWDA